MPTSHRLERSEINDDAMNLEKHRSEQGARARHETNLLQKHCCRAHSLTDLDLVQAQVSPSWECSGPSQNPDMILKLMLLAR